MEHLSSLRNIRTVLVLIGTMLALRRWLQMRLVANKVAGAYVAEDVIGRTRIPMPGAGLTIISARPWWSLDPSTLEVRARDISDGRDHRGLIQIAPGCRTAERNVDYEQDNERSRQRIEFGDNHALLHINPEEPTYGRHVLRRARGLLLLD